MSLPELPAVRGKLLRNEALAPYTWFRVGGPADALFLPADNRDFGDFLMALPADIPVTVLGVGSNVIVRDGGIEGVVVRLAGRAFAEIQIDPEKNWVIAGPGALDSMVAKAAARAGLAGLEFMAGIPGTVGGALTMNAGCYGREIKDVLVTAWGYDRGGDEPRIWDNADFAFTYRGNGVPADMTWMQAVFQGTPDDPAAIDARIAEITARREQTQPIREKYGLDKPWYIQYGKMLGGVLRGDFGSSLKYEGQSVNAILWRTLPVSATLGPSW